MFRTSGGGVLCQNIADDRSCDSTEKASVSWYAESAGSHQSTYYVYVTGLDGATGFVTTKFIDVDATSSDNVCYKSGFMLIVSRITTDFQVVLLLEL